jgi:hypothetical protein
MLARLRSASPGDKIGPPRMAAKWNFVVLFHWSFGWPIMVTLLPITLLLPWIVQRRRNTSVGIIIHAVFNAAVFVVVASGVGT